MTTTLIGTDGPTTDNYLLVDETEPCDHPGKWEAFRAYAEAATTLSVEWLCPECGYSYTFITLVE